MNNNSNKYLINFPVQETSKTLIHYSCLFISHLKGLFVIKALLFFRCLRYFLVFLYDFQDFRCFVIESSYKSHFNNFNI